MKQEPTGGIVYLLESAGFYKIGLTVNLKKRLRQLRTGVPHVVKVIHTIESDNPAALEKHWHRRFTKQRVRGEWFNLSADDVSEFRLYGLAPDQITANQTAQERNQLRAESQRLRAELLQVDQYCAELRGATGDVLRARSVEELIALLPNIERIAKPAAVRACEPLKAEIQKLSDEIEVFAGHIKQLPAGTSDGSQDASDNPMHHESRKTPAAQEKAAQSQTERRRDAVGLRGWLLRMLREQR
jgi:hypothetical protein